MLAITDVLGHGQAILEICSGAAGAIWVLRRKCVCSAKEPSEVTADFFAPNHYLAV